MPDKILTAAEVEAMVKGKDMLEHETTRFCPRCAIASLATSHLALLRERDRVGHELQQANENLAVLADQQ